MADLDLAQRRDWLELFPFLSTRRPDSYAALTAPVRAEHRREADRERRRPAPGDRRTPAGDAVGDRPHERTWMAWPPPGYTLGDTPDGWPRRPAARGLRSRNAVVGFEPVTRGGRPAATSTLAREHLRPGRRASSPAALDDAWMRDIGPTFVVGGRHAPGRGRLGVQRLGRPSWATWDTTPIGALVGGLGRRRGHGLDSSTRAAASTSTAWAPCCSPRPCSSTRDATPGLTRADVEAELARTIGATTCIWLPRGLTRDYDEFGTRGHVDIVATIASPGVVLLHEQRDPAHPDHAVSRELA